MFFVSKFCFLCLNTYKNLKLILIQNSDGLIIQKELNYCFPEIVDSQLQIPKYVCNDCTSQLKCFYKFKKNCLRSDKYLKSYFQTLTHIDEAYKHLSVRISDIKYNNKVQGVSIYQTLLTGGIDDLRTTEKDDNRTCLEGTVLESDLQCADDIIVKEEFLTPEDNADCEFYDKYLKSITTTTSTSSIEDIVDKDSKYSSCENNSINPETNEVTRKKIETKKFECPICKKKFMYKRSLIEHKQIHINNYECLICRKKFMYKRDLVEHEIVHTDTQVSYTFNHILDVSNTTQTITTDDIYNISPSKRKSSTDWNKFECQVEFVEEFEANQNNESEVFYGETFCSETNQNSNSAVCLDTQPSSTFSHFLDVSNTTQTVTTDDIYNVSPSKRKSSTDWNKFECKDEDVEVIEENPNNESEVFYDKTFCSETNQNSNSAVCLDLNKINCTKEYINGDSNTEGPYQIDDSEDECVPVFDTNSSSSPESTVAADEMISRCSYILPSDKINIADISVQPSTNNVLLAEKVLTISETESYTKKFFCLFCKKIVTRFARHITTFHKYEPKVLDILRYPMKHLTRKKLIAKLRNEGSLHYNTENNGNELIVTRRLKPKSNHSAKDFTACPKCSAYYVSRTFYKHYKTCFMNDEIEEATGFLLRLNFNQINLFPGIYTLLKDINDIEISRVIKKDYLLLHITSLLGHKYLVDKHLNSQSIQKMRKLGQLFLTIKSNNPEIIDFQDCFKPPNFPKVISGVQKLCALNLESGQYRTSVIVYNLVIYLQEACDILQSLCVIEQNVEKKQLVIDFKNLLVLEYSACVARETRKTIEETNWNHALSSTSDIVILTDSED